MYLNATDAPNTSFKSFRKKKERKKKYVHKVQFETNLYLHRRIMTDFEHIYNLYKMEKIRIERLKQTSPVDNIILFTHYVQVQTTPFLSAEARGFPSPLHEQHRTGVLCSFSVPTISALDTDQIYTDPSADPAAT